MNTRIKNILQKKVISMKYLNYMMIWIKIIILEKFLIEKNIKMKTQIILRIVYSNNKPLVTRISLVLIIKLYILFLFKFLKVKIN